MIEHYGKNTVNNFFRNPLNATDEDVAVTAEYARCVKACQSRMVIGKKCGGNKKEEDGTLTRDETNVAKDIVRNATFVGVTEFWSLTSRVWCRRFHLGRGQTGTPGNCSEVEFRRINRNVHKGRAPSPQKLLALRVLEQIGWTDPADESVWKAATDRLHCEARSLGLSMV